MEGLLSTGPTPSSLYVGTADQNWFSVVVFKREISVYTKDIHFKLLGLPLHISPYFWYWIVAAYGPSPS